MTLVEATLEACFALIRPEGLIGGLAYDSDPLNARLAERGDELLVPHRRNQRKPCAQDGYKLRRYKQRWKIERLLAWLTNSRQLVVRYECHLVNYPGFTQLGCIVILLRHYL